MTSTLIRRAGVLALTAATTVTLTGCAGVLGARMTYDDTEKAKVTDIVVTGGSGDVMIKSAAVTETTIKRVIRRSSNPGESYRLTGTTLNLDTSCGDNCSVSYEITAPAGVAVRGDLRSGDVALTGIGAVDLQLTSGDVMIRNATGPVKVHATSGDIEVLESNGPVQVESTSGDVRAMQVAGPVQVKLTSGDVEVKLTAANSVTAETTSGDVNVIVPPGSYRVMTDTNSGDASVQGLTNDATSKLLLDVRTHSGNASVVAAP
ncbi:DUF4097 family beta strand repeat-containing protein [Micromonosporaceae bacterium Da 78-11]